MLQLCPGDYVILMAFPWRDCSYYLLNYQPLSDISEKTAMLYEASTRNSYVQPLWLA